MSAAEGGRSAAIGIAMALASTVAAALTPVLTRYGAQHIEPLVFCAGTNLAAAAAMLPLLAAQGGIGQLFARACRARLIAFAFLGSVSTSLALIYGLRHASAIAGVLLLQTEPVYSLMLTGLILGEVPTPAQVGATVMILGGISSAYLGAGAVTLGWGAMLIALTPLMWQSSHIISLRLMPPLSPTFMTTARFTYSSLMLSALLMAAHPHDFMRMAHVDIALPIIATGLLSYAAGAYTWYGAISRLSLSWTTAVSVPGVPLLSVAFAIIFLGERATLRELVGLGVAVCGIVVLIVGADPRRRGTVQALEVPTPPGI
jgi:drug/metabolite transporter (DMT)-like permease